VSPLDFGEGLSYESGKDVFSAAPCWRSAMERSYKRSVLNLPACPGRRVYPNAISAKIFGADLRGSYNGECNAPRVGSRIASNHHLALIADFYSLYETGGVATMLAVPGKLWPLKSVFTDSRLKTIKEKIPNTIPGMPPITKVTIAKIKQNQYPP